MPVSEPAKKALRSFGLTEYETEAYLTILHGGKLTASQISLESKIPYSRVYDVLKRLDAKGWITSIPGKPNKYEVNPPKDTIRAFRLAELRGLEKKEKLLIDELTPMYEQKGGAERSSVVILHGEANLLSKIRDIMTSARESIFIALPELSADLLTYLASWFQSLKLRKITVKLLTPSLPKEVRPLFSFAEVRLSPGLYASGIVADREATLLILPESEDYLRNPLQWAIFSEHMGLALLSTQYFDHLWEGAKPKED
ncbi:MAG: TrmB family transcriptional regulator [Candidatus Ranarchaeia archaeon]|jgi:sugar-specific transcriptional regulator TrmB